MGFIDKLTNTMLMSKKILVVGDVMVDECIFGDTYNHSPEITSPILVNPYKKYKLGGAANVASIINALGVNVTLVSCVGNDEYGEIMIHLLEEQGISIDYVFQWDNIVTTVKSRFYLDISNHYFRVDKERYHEYDFPLNYFDELERLIQQHDAIILSDYNKGFLSDIFTKKIISIANKHKKITVVDPKSGNVKKYAGCYLIKPNLYEFRREYKDSLISVDDVFNNYLDILKKLGIDRLLITLGERGVVYLSKNKKPLHYDSRARYVIDTIGAGDVVCAILTICFMCGLSEEDSVELANKCASMSVERNGTSIINIDEFKSLLPVTNKIIYDRCLLRVLRAIYKDKKLVFINGCFDIVHLGHMDLIRQAKQKGDILFVAINSDKSVKGLKGYKRPICNYEERTLFMTYLNDVDWVYCFDDETDLLNTITELRPDIIVKGEDYLNKPIVGQAVIESIGGKLEFIHHTYGISTSKIIETIKERY